MSKRGRPRKSGARGINGRLVANVEPCQRVIERRELYAFVKPTKGPDGRGGTIDQDVCDGIGQMHALGLFDGLDTDARDLRDKGREWRDHYCGLLKRSGFKTGSYERMDKARHEARYTGRDERFDEADARLIGRPRSALLQLLVDPLVGSYPDGRSDVYWAESLIAEGLLKRGKIPPRWMQPVFLPTPEVREMLDCAIDGLIALAGERKARLAA